MAKNEKTSSKVASVAARLLRNPKSATQKDIRVVAATALTQAADKKKNK